MHWVHTKASERAAAFGIPAFTPQHTAGVAKRIVPAIASTNAVVAAACSLEALKAATLLAPSLDNYCLFNGGDGVYSAVVSHERDAGCPVCSAGVPVAASASGDSLLDLVARLQQIPPVAASLGLDRDKKEREDRIDTVSGPGEPGSAAAAAVEEKKGQMMMPSSVAVGRRCSTAAAPLRRRPPGRWSGSSGSCSVLLIRRHFLRSTTSRSTSRCWLRR